MKEPGDVTNWIAQAAQGDEAAVEGIWQRYFEKLVSLARKKLERVPRRAADEEDVALSAMQSFCRGVRDGRFPQLGDRHDLWKLLVTITVRKAVAQMRSEHARKRGGGHVRGESVFIPNGDVENLGGISQIISEEPTPEFACQVAETCGLMLERLGDEELKTVALYKMQGYSNEEISEELDCAVRTVERKLARIRQLWESGQE